MTEFYFNNIQLLDLELSNRCNASCPMCARNIHGWSINPRLKLNELTLDDIKNIDKQYLDVLDTINISGNYGDPMVCTQLLEIIYYFLNNTSARIILNTNGGIRSTSVWETLGKYSKKYWSDESKLEIRFAIDGLEDTNHIYRIGVHWKMLIDNVKAYINAGGDATWRYLIFYHNQHQVDEATNLAGELGFNSFKSIVTGRWRDDNFPVLDKNGNFKYNLFPGDVDISEYKQFDHRKKGSLNIGQKINSKGYAYLSQKEKVDTFKDKDWKEFITDNSQPVLSCYAEKDKRVYIDANGYVFPCNSLGYTSGWAIRHESFGNQVVDEMSKYSNTNIKEDNLSTILNGEWIKHIWNSWNAYTIQEGRFMMCSYTCGKKGTHKMIKEHEL